MNRDSELADTPELPYVAVIFTSRKCVVDDGYRDMVAHISGLVRDQAGFLGMESVRNEEGFGITVSYWRDEASVLAWRSHSEHREVQQVGKQRWYDAYRVRVCEVKRDYGFDRERGEK